MPSLDIHHSLRGPLAQTASNYIDWLRLHLDKSEFEEQRLLSPTLTQQLQTPRVHVAAPEFAECSDVHYGLGFRLHSYRGERVVWHGGGWSGWSTLRRCCPIVASVSLFSPIVDRAQRETQLMRFQSPKPGGARPPQ